MVFTQEHLLVTQDEVEVARVERSIEECKKTLIDLGHAEFTFEDFLVVRSLAMELKVILGMLNTSLTFI